MNVSLEEYFRTTFEDKLLVKMPEREDDHLTAATRLLEKRREMQEVEQALAAQKEEFQMKMESLQQRREELERKEFQLKESLLKFDKFLKENDAKRARALKKAGDEREYKRQKEREIDRLKDDINVYANIKEKLQKKIEKYIVYHKYLEKVIEISEDFNEIREVIDRFETLTGNLKDLKERELKNQNINEDNKQELNRYREIKNNEILSQNNQLAGLQSRLDKAQSAAVQWESEWNHIKNTAAKQTLDMGRIKMATHNLYLLVNRHQRQLGDVALDDTNEQLIRIKTFIQDLTFITNEIKRETALATSQAGASSS